MAGGLLWLARSTRPDICFAVHKLTRRTQSLTITDWNLGKRILRYLKGKRYVNMKLDTKVIINQWKLTAYSDVDYVAITTDRNQLPVEYVT